MNRQYGALSGVAIVLIALNHAIHFGLQVSPIDGRWLQFLTLLQALGAFAVPIFLFVSGAFMAYSARQLSFTFIRSSLERILWPYIIWSTVFYLQLILTSDQRYSVSVYAKNLVVGYPYHFVPLLIFWYLAAPILVKFGKRAAVLFLVATAVYQVFLLALRFPAMFGLREPLGEWARLLAVPVLFNSLTDWAIYFPLGLALSMHGPTFKATLLRMRWFAVATTVALFLAGILDAFDVISAAWARFAAPLPLMFLLPVTSRESIPMVRRFEMVGRRSYGIYLAHFVAINLVAFFAAKAAFDLYRLPAIIYPSLFLLALGVPLLLMQVMASVAPGRRVFRYAFGIMPAAADVRRLRRDSAMPPGRQNLPAGVDTSAPPTPVHLPPV